ncbi:ArsR/SmtB family transcription factor [Hydrotalea sandarakina]|jgi:DNA-binding transcriptional ArsR family regulator|uniref:DNA-binding transcriptional ArsR family regulator n=1 Tax=Hydrotalea sandarakina TaxID=1004304 RepID=A0A2W7S4K2_9BACT|nr:metalloregulator ArsR/SmtB family transcription factor [Hydrotalea sandarakina]PZX66056.1 DNA-binding transcriptional ArsR family regulator [Hydrotalea sandarakina]
MGVAKKELFTKEQNQIAAIAKALSHPARIAIVQALLKSDACVCGYLVEQTGLAQSTTSQHLKELKNAGIIKGSVEGVNVCYCIDEKNWNKYKQLFNKFFAAFENTDKQCC